MKKSLIFIPLFFIFALLVISCTSETKEKVIKKTDLTEFETSQGLKKFSSVQEMKDFLDKANVNAQGYDDFGFGAGRELMRIAEAVPIEKSAIATDSGGGRAAEYSKTNVQVEGVDEADFVKNDDKYIYVITQNKLVIADAFPAENAKILSKTELKGNSRDMFVNKDRLVVFADDNEQVPVFAEFDFVPRPRYTQKTHAYVYDISDKSNPKLVKDYNLNGYYLESRMIGNYVYFIVQENVYYYNKIIDVPVMMESSKVVLRPEIYYFDNPELNYNFNTVASFDIFGDDEDVNAKTFMMGWTNTIYVSQNNIYITYQKNLQYTYYERHNENRFYDVVVPLLPSDMQAKINVIKNDNSLSSYQKWDKISNVLQEMYNRMEENDKQEFIEKVEKAVEEYEIKLEVERRKTVIHRIKIDKENIEYGAKGEVPGYLLNQFSMDEHENNLRVATTTEIWTRESVMYNNVFVLNEKMETIGKLEALAPDERIYSTRFMGNRLYMVTFKRIDPLFVIDLSNPKNLEVLGELKIPGFSDYLHPYDENHIIGVGKETEGDEWGGVSIKGVKLALFDVSDVKNLKQLYKYEIGEAGTDSEALRDHKAFLFDKKKNLLVIPITEVKGKLEYDSRLGYYRQRYWQGAYVFGLSPEDGFEVKGKMIHNEGEEQDYYYYGSPNSVRRSLFIDDVLYTVSGIKIKANDLSNISNEIKEIKLPYEREYYPYPVQRGGEPIIVE